MKTYKYIPFPELRRQYRRQQKRKQEAAEFIKTSTLVILYGIAAGLMMAGLWVTL